MDEEAYLAELRRLNDEVVLMHSAAKSKSSKGPSSSSSSSSSPSSSSSSSSSSKTPSPPSPPTSSVILPIEITSNPIHSVCTAHMEKLARQVSLLSSLAKEDSSTITALRLDVSAWQTVANTLKTKLLASTMSTGAGRSSPLTTSRRTSRTSASKATSSHSMHRGSKKKGHVRIASSVSSGATAVSPKLMAARAAADVAEEAAKKANEAFEVLQETSRAREVELRKALFVAETDAAIAAASAAEALEAERLKKETAENALANLRAKEDTLEKIEAAARRAGQVVKAKMAEAAAATAAAEGTKKDLAKTRRTLEASAKQIGLLETRVKELEAEIAAAKSTPPRPPSSLSSSSSTSAVASSSKRSSSARRGSSGKRSSANTLAPPVAKAPSGHQRVPSVTELSLANLRAEQAAASVLSFKDEVESLSKSLKAVTKKNGELETELATLKAAHSKSLTELSGVKVSLADVKSQLEVANEASKAHTRAAKAREADAASREAALTAQLEASAEQLVVVRAELAELVHLQGGGVSTPSLSTLSNTANDVSELSSSGVSSGASSGVSVSSSSSSSGVNLRGNEQAALRAVASAIAAASDPKASEITLREAVRVLNVQLQHSRADSHRASLRAADAERERARLLGEIAVLHAESKGQAVRLVETESGEFKATPIKGPRVRVLGHEDTEAAMRAKASGTGAAAIAASRWLAENDANKEAAAIKESLAARARRLKARWVGHMRSGSLRTSFKVDESGNRVDEDGTTGSATGSSSSSSSPSSSSSSPSPPATPPGERPSPPAAPSSGVSL